MEPATITDLRIKPNFIGTSDFSDTAQIRHYYDLLEAEPDTDPYLIDFFKILEEIIADGRNLHELQIAETEALEDIARGTSPAAVYAQSLLAMPTLSTYIRQTQPIQISGKKPFNTSIVRNGSWLYPNPATKTFTVHTTLPWQSLILYNLYGQTVVAYHPSELPHLLLPDNISNGLYLAKLTFTEGTIQTVKLLVSK
ncbi:MAG: T9SS type A sorting domain-containing protein [Sphingobacteriales bacterium]|nr:MAG: T9SS type A sorting domain-containing protein [Sphingobacteriales bacterium]